jgi:hypothetical protein
MFQLFRLFRFLDRNRPSRKPRPKPPRKVWTFRPCLEVLEDRLTPATFVVTNTGDAGVGTGPDANGVYSGDLRYCITQLNNSTDPNNLIAFDPSVTGTITLNSSLPTIQKPVTISGPGSNVLAVSGGTGVARRVFSVWAGAPVEIDGLEIEQGVSTTSGGGISNLNSTLTLKNDFLTENAAQQDGGAICNSSNAVLNLVNCTIMQNSAQQDGGGIANFGTLTDNGSDISGNYAGLAGGGYYSSALQGGQGVANLTNTQIAGNTAASGGGGGVYLDSNSQFNLNGGAISNNQALAGAGGGGVYLANSATAVLTNTAVASNAASGGRGGGVFVNNSNFTMHGGGIGMNEAGDTGGGLELLGGTVLLDQNCTLGNNTAANNGGGLYNASGSLTLGSLTVQGNTAGTNGGGMYLANGSTTKFDGWVTVQGHKATNGKGSGIYEQNGSDVSIGLQGGYTDKDDPDGQPVPGP